ncbi:unnamed protein product [Eruca vesicaria subsp. sativa]|uniref:RRM domain-containing protein n=1 Tax=Eruca vesicaria subsp. sativa TaxID=29727 RepID=A0ABC8LW42_ERUVS|nr:unnamed protein product [Eruca vesicaria subsp. sativa]
MRYNWRRADLRSKRVSGFDMALPASAMLATVVAATAGQVPMCQLVLIFQGCSPTSCNGPWSGKGSYVPASANIPGMFPNILQWSMVRKRVPAKVRRPTDNNPSLAAALGPIQPNPCLNLAAVGLSSGSTGGLEGPDRIFVGGLPYYFTLHRRTNQGALGVFWTPKRKTGNSKGYAFCVFQDPLVTDIACAALNGIKMGDKTLIRLMLQPGGTSTKIVCLIQVVTADDLGDDEEFEDIMEDMRQEGGKFGNSVNVVIPRPNLDHDPTPGVGNVIFLEYADVDGAAKAISGMNGRKFGGNQVVAVYYPENKYAQGDYER